MTGEPRAQAERAVLRAAVERGYLTPGQVEAAVAQRSQASLAGADPGILPLLRPLLTPPQVAELADLYRSVAGASAAGPTVVGGLAPSPGGWREGARIEDLTLGEKLGQGGMGAVYRAVSQGGQRYAVKALAAEADPSLLLRFEREGQAQARVDAHPNVLRVHRAGRALGHLYLVLDLAEGGDLSDRLAAGPMPADAAAALVRDLAGGLAHVHGLGILHRDLKPANVLFDAAGTPKLTDFGLARLSGADRLTATGDLLGTPAYAAPEQVSGERSAVDERSDVYGLGAILYACLTGQAPFAGEGTISTIRKVLDEPPKPPSALAPGVPPNLEGICLRALAKEPVDRFPTAVALGEALGRFLAGEDTGDRAPRRRRWLAAAVATGVLVLAAAGWAALGSAGARSGGERSTRQSRRGPRPARGAPPRPREPAPPPAFPELFRGDGWALAFGLTLETLPQLDARLEAEGLGIVSLAAEHPQVAPSRFAAAWWAAERPRILRLERSRRDLRERPEGAPDDYQQVALVPYDPTPHPDKKPRIPYFFADVWGPWPAAGGATHTWQNLAQLEQADAEQRQEGNRLVWLSGYPQISKGLNAIWRHDETPTGYISYAGGSKDKVLDAPGTLVSLDTWAGEGLLNVLVWRDDGRRSQFFEALSRPEAAVVAARLTAEGYRPLAFLERTPEPPPGSPPPRSGEAVPRSITWSWVRDPRPSELAVDGPDSELASALDAEVEAFLREQPGATRLALAVTRGLHLAVARGYRYGPACATPTPADARFRLGLLSSLLSAVAVLQVVEQGDLRLGWTLEQLLPSFARARAAVDPEAAAVTLLDLLAHRWGGPDRASLLTADRMNDTTFRLVPRAPSDVAQVLERAAAAALPDPRGGVHVAPAGYVVAAAAAERATRMPLAEQIRQQVSGPLRARGLLLARERVTGLLPDEVGYEGLERAVPVDADNVIAPLQYGGIGIEALAAALGWLGSAPDLARFVCAFHDPAHSLLLPQAAIERMWTRPGDGDSMALGWRTEGPPSDPRAWLTARMPGSAGHAERFPGGLGLVVLVNGDVDLTPLVERLRARLDRVAAWPEEDLFERY